MQSRLFTILLGVALVLGTGTSVYKVKTQTALLETTQVTGSDTIATTGQIPVQNISDKSRDGEVEEDEDEEEDDDVKQGQTVPPTQPAVVPSTPSAPSSGGISLAEVARHNSRTSCWSAINGGVYDLTSWIPNHPGGEQKILSICGINGSTQYNGQHTGGSKQMTILAGFKIGALAQ